jgi:hypothetical protein
MPKRKEPELTPKEQFKRFVETAREHEVDETGKEFELAFNKIRSKKQDSKKDTQDRS